VKSFGLRLGVSLKHSVVALVQRGLNAHEFSTNHGFGGTPGIAINLSRLLTLDFGKDASNPCV
jgi:hypothetical protein